MAVHGPGQPRRAERLDDPVPQVGRAAQPWRSTSRGPGPIPPERLNVVMAGCLVDRAPWEWAKRRSPADPVDTLQQRELDRGTVDDGQLTSTRPIPEPCR